MQPRKLDVTSDVAGRLSISLLLLRLSLGAVMMVWAFDKMLNPEHGAAVLEGFYGLAGVGEQVIRLMGVVQGIIVLGFLLGIAKTWTYGAVLLMHAVTTLVSWRAYLGPLENILFFSAWPMLAGLVSLFLLRREDRTASFRGHVVTRQSGAAS
jgi:hypothetical protein